MVNLLSASRKLKTSITLKLQNKFSPSLNNTMASKYFLVY